MYTMIRQAIKYIVIVLLGTFLAFGGSPPQTKTSQDGSTATTRFYGQPFKFHTSTTRKTITGKTTVIAAQSYKTGQALSIAFDIAIWSILLWIIVRMAEQKPIRFWRNNIKITPQQDRKAQKV
jgi:hypothetical protein